MRLCFPADRKDRHYLWRLSFSRAEKQLTKHADKRHSGTDCPEPPITCRKVVLRVLKRMLEIIKGVDNSRVREPDPKMMALQKAAEYLRKERGRRKKIEKYTTFQVSSSVLFTLCTPVDKFTIFQLGCRILITQYTRVDEFATAQLASQRRHLC